MKDNSLNKVSESKIFELFTNKKESIVTEFFSGAESSKLYCNMTIGNITVCVVGNYIVIHDEFKDEEFESQMTGSWWLMALELFEEEYKDEIELDRLDSAYHDGCVTKSFYNDEKKRRAFD